jgi:hypothetical protein
MRLGWVTVPAYSASSTNKVGMHGIGKKRGPGWQLRLTLLLMIGGWIVMSPGYRQILEGRSKWFPRWVMFHGFGRNVCDVNFFQTADGGETLVSLDRFEVLDRKRTWSENKSLVRMDNKSAVQAVGRRVCKALGEEADVRATARCGSRGKWVVKYRAKTNLCESTNLPSVKKRLRGGA